MENTEPQYANIQEPLSSTRKINFKLNLGVAGFWISLISLISPFVLFILQSNHDYKLHQHEVQPVLMIKSLGTTSNINIFEIPVTDSLERSNDTIEVDAQIEIGMHLVIKNIGNSNAIFLFEMLKDSSVGEEILNADILHPNFKDPYDYGEKPFFASYQLNVGDSIITDMMHRIYSYNDSSFAIHIIIVYKNNLDQFYYSYYTALFGFNTDEMYAEYDSIRSSPNFVKSLTPLTTSIKLIKENSTNAFYSKSDRRRVIKFIKEMEKGRDMN